MARAATIIQLQEIKDREGSVVGDREIVSGICTYVFNLFSCSLKNDKKRTLNDVYMDGLFVYMERRTLSGSSQKR